MQLERYYIILYIYCNSHVDVYHGETRFAKEVETRGEMYNARKNVIDFWKKRKYEETFSLEESVFLSIFIDKEKLFIIY